MPAALAEWVRNARLSSRVLPVEFFMQPPAVEGSVCGGVVAIALRRREDNVNGSGRVLLRFCRKGAGLVDCSEPRSQRPEARSFRGTTARGPTLRPPGCQPKRSHNPWAKRTGSCNESVGRAGALPTLAPQSGLHATERKIDSTMACRGMAGPSAAAAFAVAQSPPGPMACHRRWAFAVVDAIAAIAREVRPIAGAARASGDEEQYRVWGVAIADRLPDCGDRCLRGMEGSSASRPSATARRADPDTPPFAAVQSGRCHEPP